MTCRKMRCSVLGAVERPPWAPFDPVLPRRRALRKLEPKSLVGPARGETRSMYIYTRTPGKKFLSLFGPRFDQSFLLSGERKKVSNALVFGWRWSTWPKCSTNRRENTPVPRRPWSPLEVKNSKIRVNLWSNRGYDLY